MDRATIVPVILSGGAGTRLWPLSRGARPKQFHALTGASTMLQTTLSRIAGGSDFEQPLVIASARHAADVESQLDGVAKTVILEPVGRNTAAAIALAALEAAPDSLLLVMPSDHVVRDPEGFVSAVRLAAAAASGGWLVTFGIRPTAPDTGYGYIRRGADVADGIYRVDQFVEKPDRETAEAYVSDGRYDWNGGIFLMRAGRYLEALKMHAPDILAGAALASETAARSGGSVRPDPACFAAIRSQSVDYAVFERDDRVAVVPVDIGWSDVGSWDALYEIGDKDGEGNVTTGNVLLRETRSSLVRSDGPLLVTVGLDDVIAVAAGDAVIVMRRGDSQGVKEVVDMLKVHLPSVLDD